jgi:hypothetical protein
MQMPQHTNHESNNRFAGLNVEVEEPTEEGELVNAASNPNAR